MKLLSDSRRRRKFIIWLEGLGAREASGPGGAEGEKEASAAGAEVAEVTEAAEALSAAREPSRQPRRTGPGRRSGARLSARKRAGPGAGPRSPPPLAAEPAPPPTVRLRTRHLAASLRGLGTPDGERERQASSVQNVALWGGRVNYFCSPSIGKRELRPPHHHHHLFGWGRKKPCPSRDGGEGNCPHSLWQEERCQPSYPKVREKP